MGAGEVSIPYLVLITQTFETRLRRAMPSEIRLNPLFGFNYSNELCLLHIVSLIS